MSLAQPGHKRIINEYDVVDHVHDRTKELSLHEGGCLLTQFYGHDVDNVIIIRDWTTYESTLHVYGTHLRF